MYINQIVNKFIINHNLHYIVANPGEYPQYYQVNIIKCNHNTMELITVIIMEILTDIITTIINTIKIMEME